jgi:DNA-binding GntR family transcriptional regulator
VEKLMKIKGKLGEFKSLTFLTEQVYEIIKEAILNLRLEPGERLIESKLAKELGTSTTPVRAALARLKHDNLIDIIPYRGAYVSKINRKDIDDIFQIRTVLETAAIRKYASNMSQKDLEQGEALIEAMRQAYEDRDMQGYIQPSRDFHFLFIKKYGNQRMIDILRKFEQNLERMRVIAVKDWGNVNALIGDYENMLDALRARDADKAAKALKFHLERTRDIFRKTKA